MKQLFEFLSPIEANSKLGDLLANFNLSCGLTTFEAEIDK